MHHVLKNKCSLLRGNTDAISRAVAEAIDIVNLQYKGPSMSLSDFSFDQLLPTLDGEDQPGVCSDEEDFGQQRVVNNRHQSVPEKNAECLFTNLKHKHAKGGGRRKDKAPSENTWREGNTGTTMDDEFVQNLRKKATASEPSSSSASSSTSTSAPSSSSSASSSSTSAPAKKKRKVAFDDEEKPQ